MGEIVRRQRPVTLPATATVQEAARLMRDRRIGAILVVAANGRLEGLFTGRDAVSRVLADARDARTTRLGEVMTREPDTLKPHHHAIDALRMMRDGGYRHMPIVHGEALVGIVSIGDFEGLEKARIDTETGFWEIL
jgi:CBS domain-containing protein